jgi:hypothetical protein
MDADSKNPTARRSLALAVGAYALALLMTGIGAFVTASFWKSLPQARAQQLNQTQLQNRWGALLKSAPQAAREGCLLWDAARELIPMLSPRASQPPQIGQRLREAMSAPSTHASRLLVAAVLMAQAESDGRTPEQRWLAIKPYIESGATAPYAHFSVASHAAMAQLYREFLVGDGTAASLADTGSEAYTTFLQFFIPRLRVIAEQRSAAGDAAGAELCRKTGRRLLREWTLEPGRVGTRLVAADLLARELEGDPSCAKLVESLRAWRKSYRDSARQRPTPVLAAGGDEPDLCSAEHAALVGSVATSVWLFVATTVAGLAALALSWALLRGFAVLCDWRIFALGGLVAIATTVSAGIVIRDGGPAVGDDLRGLMIRVTTPTLAKPKRSDPFAPVYRAQLPWAAAGWTVAVLAAGGLLGAALYRRNRLAGAAGALGIGWLLIAVAWTVQSAWGSVRVNRYESALADAYRKGVYAAVAGDSAEALLAPLRDWQP